MVKLKHECYVRFILLLLKGGSEVLQKLVIKGLEIQNITLDKFLEENRAKICSSKEISDSQRDLLYPPSGSHSDITKWDTSLLVFIILECLREYFSDTYISSVETLRATRNAFFAHHNSAVIEVRKYTRLWSEVSSVITTICHSLKERDYCMTLISSVASIQLDTDTEVLKCISELKGLAITDEFSEVIQTSLDALERSLQPSRHDTAAPSQDNANRLLTEKMEQVNIKEAGSSVNDDKDTEEDEHDKHSTYSDTDSIKSKEGQDINESSEAQVTVSMEKKKKRKKNKKNRKKDKESKRAKLQLPTVDESGVDLVTGDIREDSEKKKYQNTLPEKNERPDNAMDVTEDTVRKQEMVFGAFKATFETDDFQLENSELQSSTCSLFGTDKKETDQSEEPNRVEAEYSNKKGKETQDDENRNSNRRKTRITRIETDTNLASGQKQSAESKNDDNKDEYDVDTGFITRQTRSRKNATAEKSNSDNRKTKVTATLKDEGTSFERGQAQAEDMMKVQFHVLISPDFKFDANVHKVAVALRSDFSNEFDVDSHHMEIVSEYPTGHIEMTYTLDVQRARITGSSRIQYKYYIKQNEHSKKGMSGNKNSWEHYVNGNDGSSKNRILHLPKNEKTTFWHQFDGIANRKDSFKRILTDIVARSARLRNDAEIAMQTFGGHILQSITNVDASPAVILGAIEMADLLMRGLRKHYFTDAKCFQSEDEMKKKLGKHIFGPVFKVFKEVSAPQTVETEHQWKRRMTIQFTLLDIWKRMNLGKDQMSLAESRRFCKAFLISANTDKKTCKELEFISKHFPTKKNFFKDALISLARVVIDQGKDPSWLYVMPMVHFLSGACSPYEVRKNTAHDAEVPTWWGITDISKKYIDLFKGYRTQRWEIPLEDILETMQPLFEVDFLLPRTIMACLNITELYEVMSCGMFPVEVSCATLVFYLKHTRTGYWYEKLMTDEEQIICKCIKSVDEQLQQGHRDSKRECPQSWLLPWITSSNLVSQALQRNRSDITANSIRVFLKCASNYFCTQEMRGCQDIASFCDKTKDWLARHFSLWNSDLEKSLMVWNDCMVPHAAVVKDIEQLWNGTLADVLHQRLWNFMTQNSMNTERIVILYCQKIDIYNPNMQNCLYRTAFKAIDRACNIDVQHFDQNQQERYGELLSRMFGIEWSKMMKNVPDGDNITFLVQILGWSPFCHFMNIFVTQQQWGLLDDECRNKLMLTISVIDTSVEGLLKGLLSIGELRLIHKHAEIFADVASLVKMGEEQSQTTKEMILSGIHIRKKELEKFLSRAELIVSLTTLCRPLKQVDVSDFDEVLEKQLTLETHTLNEFCHPVDIVTVKNINEFEPDLSVFKLPENIDSILETMHTCRKSSVFFRIWKSQCKTCFEECKTLDDVLRVWKPVYKRWKEISEKVERGNIHFREFENFISRKLGEDYNTIVTELRILKVTEEVIETRVEQLKKYRHIEACTSGAESLLQFKREYNMTGDFEQIEIIADTGRENIEMEQFDNTLMEACEFLKDFTDSKARCLETFLKCQPLVQWLKETMHTSGLKELQVFVDLASMSIGDDPYNIGKVQALHSAVTGYAPLIFDLQEECGCKDLLDLCKLVWRELKANPKLPKQLEDTNSQIEWLKEIKSAHGIVEVTSMMQTEAINTDGTYTVGRLALEERNGPTTLTNSNVSIANSVRLIVPEVKGKRQQRNYTFSELQDLQSRLMLVAGKADKGTEGVERFTMIFDSITRLSKVFVDLHMSGCVLFKDWSARFICDPDPTRPVCSIITFGHGAEVQQLKGRRSVNEDLKDMIPKIARFMECCHKEWLQHINDKRKTHVHLNYFTVDQLVILQRELVKFGTDDEPSHLIYPLLSAVKGECTEDDIIQAMMSAKRLIGRDVDMDADSESDISDTEVESNVGDTEDEKRRTFIRNLVEAGQDEGLAIKALAADVDPEDFHQGILWCIEHCDSDISDEECMITSETAADKDSLSSAFGGWSKSDVSMQNVINVNISNLGKHSNVGTEPLIQDLQRIWNRFLESISSNIRDYLNVEHLGIILQELALRDSKLIERSLPPGLKEGSPNLIVCPTDDVLLTALSIYMMDKDKPLPQSDEILMCSHRTTKDEVDIFWRRALVDKSCKIHCLLNADFLEYEVSEASQRGLQEYLQELNKTEDTSYRLCIICGRENEYRTAMVSFLDKYRTPPPPVNREKLRCYIAERLSLEQDLDYSFKPAAFVDSERSSVRVIKSLRAGVGKTLFKMKREDALLRLNDEDDSVSTEVVSIPLQEKEVDINYLIERLLEHTLRPGEKAVRLFHIDIAHEVQEGIDYLLFNLLVLGCLTDKTGYVWRKLNTDMYLIESMPILTAQVEKRGSVHQCVHPMFNILPDVICRSPQESLLVYEGAELQDQTDSDQLFDEDEFNSEKYQRPFQYLQRLERKGNMEDVNPKVQEGDQQSCLKILLRYCGIKDPSWSELHHFVWFLNTQLVDYKQNNFVSAAAAEDLPGFSTFVLRFLIQMSKDFSTRSLHISEESPGLPHGGYERMETEDIGIDERNDDILELYQMRRTWESSPHPYLFFNSDRLAFTFIGFNIEKASGDLIDQQTGQVLEEAIMKRNLHEALERNHVPLQENFNSLARKEKIKRLQNVMGVASVQDPDSTYELTTDNVKKIMAIYMRFRCDIPVIIMGETGCGKTRLVKFLCELQVPDGKTVTNLVLMKVHGGTTSKDIIRKVRNAETLAKLNRKRFGKHMYTVLFLDEANSTEAIGLIKEIMCDKSMEGEKLKLCDNLKIVAACNPYRKHTEELIKKLEQAGLGYHVDADETTDRLGRVPMRRLVYRVQPLPQSLLPLVWDFGQLNTQVEDLYIQQMVKRHISAGDLPNIFRLTEVTSAILTASQDYMRRQKDECSFVSLRDVERVLTVMSWFYGQCQNDERMLYNLMDTKLYGENIDDDDSADEAIEEEEVGKEEEEDEEEEERKERPDKVTDVTRSLILALGVCYHSCLKTREQYREFIAPYFQPPLILPRGEQQIFEEIDCCQDVFLDQVDLEKNIARNLALKENVFMMIVCIELRIPLFLIGKPGSSKSLAKTIVSDAMRGNASKQELFRKLKQVQMASFQCSPLSTADGIVGTFKQCAQFQKDKNLDTFVSVVVLDEVGLAEDSPRMPLKALHPLLEDGIHGEDEFEEYEKDECHGEEESEEIENALHVPPLLEDGCHSGEETEKYRKVAFIGISNWALDPAKMNRGIVVQREVPDIEELINSARGICSTDEEIFNRMEHLIKPMAESYLELFNTASKKMREFFGLRDFYSLIKMVFSFVETSKQEPTWHQMLHAIRRNFEGLDQVDPVESFKNHLSTVIHIDDEPKPDDPDCTASGLIRACVFDTKNIQSESRYLLLLTEDYGALTIIQQLIFGGSEDIRPITIFGSSFRCDQEYTQVCLNINKIKVCMETGNTVVLLNLENLYESLYDALNQYYVNFGDVRYVDLGLGTHRVKCPVHPKFRLIVIAEKETVYKKFPIPLINRLEKHFLTINTMLSPDQRRLASQLEQWARDFASESRTRLIRRENSTETKVGDVFIGYHEDSCSAIILHVYQIQSQQKDVCENKLLDKAKRVLLWCATPDALVRLEENIVLVGEKQELTETYFNVQAHGSILEYINHMICSKKTKQLFSQITTHSKLLTTVHMEALSSASGIDLRMILLLETLSTFDTEQQFSNKIRQHMKISMDSPKLIVIQCDSGNVNANLIACARYCVIDEFEKMREELRAPVHMILIVQLPKVAGGCFTGFQCGKWHSAHIDDLLSEEMHLPTLEEMHGKSIGMLIDSAIVDEVEMETDDITIYERTQLEERMDTGSFTEESVPCDMDTNVPTTSYKTMRQQDIKLDEVLFDLENVDQRKQLTFRKEQKTTKLDMKKLVLSTVQSALSMVKDKTERSNRETERVDLVIMLLHQDPLEGQSSFLQGVCIQIAKILKEKETRTGAVHRATYWLVNEAATLDNINKAGTFRSSCIKVLESKVSPILAGIIAYCDSNENLSILEETQYPWKQQLWLGIFNTPSVIHLQYKDLQSPVKNSDLIEVTVVSTGYEGRKFCARMPFSWLFIEKINEVLNTGLASAEGTGKEYDDYDNIPATNVRAETCRRLLSQHPLCTFYDDIREERIVEDARLEYIWDIIHTMYPAKTKEEFDLVFDSIRATSEQMQGETSGSSLLNSVIFIHLAYEALSTRLTYFHMLNVTWPACSATLLDLKAKTPNHHIFKENEITFAGVFILIENMCPGKGELDIEDGRAEWLSKAHHYRSIVEKVISTYDENATIYGASAAQIVRRIKALWCRVMVMKLFIEHICMSEEEYRMPMKLCNSLWLLLGDEADMKNVKSVIALEKFLKACNKGAMKHCFGSLVECSVCEKALEGVPITLPCKDVLCERCYTDLKAAKRNRCAKCQHEFTDDWVPEETDVNILEETFQDYQKRCNTFFMDVVSQLSFADKAAPSDEVIEKILGYAFCAAHGRQHTKHLSIFDTGIDPNPVFRSFLLQQLLLTSENKVMKYLEKYIKEAEAIVTENVSDMEEIYLMVIHCVEDKLKQADGTNDEGLISRAAKGLQTADDFITRGSIVQKLYGLASARMGLAVAADVIAKLVTVGSLGMQEIDLINCAKQFCENSNTNWPRTYLVKYLCRFHGISVYQAACNSQISDLQWIAFIEMDKVVCDRFIVCDKIYTEVRETVTRTLLEGNIDILNEMLMKLHEKHVNVEPMLQLAIYRVVTSSHLHPQVQRKIKPEMLMILSNFIKECDTLNSKELLVRIVENQLLPTRLITEDNEDLRLQGLQSLLIHFLTTLTYFKGDRTLLYPLITLVENPEMCTDFFLPTMPQDDLEDIKRALLASLASGKGSDEKLVFYRCPNGHAYVIGDCGRPYYTGKCACGADIGGALHKLLDSNTVDTGKDVTMTGHILGQAEERGIGPKPERLMTPAHCAVIRCFVHMAMYLGVGKSEQGINELIKPDVDTEQVEEFLWNHIELDIDDICKALSRSADDVLLFIHSVIDGIMVTNDSGNIIEEELYLLSTKRGRQEWEIAFADKFLRDHLMDMDAILQNSNQMIVNDSKLGADPLLSLLYEVDRDSETQNATVLQEVPNIWRYRTPVSLQHLRQKLEAENGRAANSRHKYKVLQFFLNEEYHLRALRFIPSILRLQRVLIQRYQKKLDKAEASQITVLRLKKDEVAGSETSQLLADFAEAWSLCRETLRFYPCATDTGAATLSDEYCRQSIRDSTPVSVLLPATEGAGLCSYVLLDFLMRKQNDFLDKYTKETGRKLGDITTVSAKDVSAAHLISYDPQQDLLPLILANCKYTFKLGEGTHIEYDFGGLERQLMDRFFFSKSVIDIGGILQIDQMVYRTEFTNASVFKKLLENIKQENLNASVKTQISDELKSLPDICQSLFNLDIAISFLKTTGGLPNQNLHQYMKKTLRMETTFASHEAQQVCQFKHIQSLWLLLALLKSKTMTDNRQQRGYTFESIQRIFDDELQESETYKFSYYMQDLSVNKLSSLVEVLHEFILLRLAVKQNSDDEDYNDVTENELKEWLLAYLEEKDTQPLDPEILLGFPGGIKLKHSVHTWVVAYNMLKGKQSGSYSRQ